ncbi:hypothetical protein M3Y98_00990600 [Aphelenchoides besseyi]|nr:hypothetical protein M3Y98_00990600 [Aphelenchoides besseyi]KAI6194815.1 hypothetical protein M3Y96_01165200 [Aphelenchoides besseyi]
MKYILDTKAQPATLKSYLHKHCYSYTVDLYNGNLSDVKVTDMQHKIRFPTIRNGKLFGFPDDQNGNINSKKLFEISLIDGSKIKHEVKGEIDRRDGTYFHPSLWINDKLLVGILDVFDYVPNIYKFDILQMKWEKTTIEVEGGIESMTLTDGLLIVHAYSPKDKLDSSGDDDRDKEFNQFIYRF